MEKQKSTIIKDALALFAITLVAGLVLGFVYQFTLPVIQQREDDAKKEAYQTVYADADKFEDDDALTASVDESANILANSGTEGITINEAYKAVDASGNQIGYVMSVSSSKGFGGQLTISIGVTNEGSVTGIEFLLLQETAGLGMNAQKPEFKDQYVGKTAENFELVKGAASGDNQISAMSGATVTSTAVTNAVNAALYFAKNVGGN